MQHYITFMHLIYTVYLYIYYNTFIYLISEKKFSFRNSSGWGEVQLQNCVKLRQIYFYTIASINGEKTLRHSQRINKSVNIWTVFEKTLFTLIP